MRPYSIWRGISLLCLCAIAICLANLPAMAQTDATVDDAADIIRVTTAAYTLEPELTETGAPVLDDDGEPVILRVPLDESVIIPGDVVLYVITLDNPTDDPAMNLRLGAQIAAELVLDPFSIIGPDGLVVEWADEENPDQFSPC